MPGSSLSHLLSPEDRIVAEREAAMQRGRQEARKEGIEIGETRAEVRLALKRFGDSFLKTHQAHLATFTDLSTLRQLAQRLSEEAVTPEEIRERLETAYQKAVQAGDRHL